ncbi:MAG: hypothetical protein QMD14_02970 [Candidatus Aenigmarchaeota archaeon]|nr:hypothetical protein [Candidatus Aenigmarchaeota archaeon]
MRGRIYRDDIPPEIRLTYHIFEGMPYFEKGTEEISYFPANFKLREKNLERWYDSVNPNIIPAILGNGQLKKLLEETISTLRVRHEKVIKLRFGWNDSRPRTLEEVSKEIGLQKQHQDK